MDQLGNFLGRGQHTREYVLADRNGERLRRAREEDLARPRDLTRPAVHPRADAMHPPCIAESGRGPAESDQRLGPGHIFRGCLFGMPSPEFNVRARRTQPLDNRLRERMMDHQHALEMLWGHSGWARISPVSLMTTA